MNPKRVLFLGPLPPPWMGPTVATEILLRSSLKEEFDLIHLDTSDHRELEKLGAVDVTNIALALKQGFRVLLLIAAKRPDLVYVPVSQTTIGFLRDALFIVTAKLFGRPVICHLRGGNFRRWVQASSRLNRAFVRLILGRVQAMIVLGEKLRKLFEGYVDDDRIHVVPNGGDFQIPRPEQGEDAQLRILYLGNLQPSKGIVDLIEAMALLEEKGASGARLEVAGRWRDEATRKKCLRLCRERDLPVTFHPPCGGAERLKRYSGTDLFVFPPREPEGHPWVIIEAMAAGLPVISTDRGAIAESVRDGENGFIVGSRRPGEVAEKIRLLADDPDLRRRMGVRSREIYHEEYTEQRMVERMAAAFGAVLDAGGRLTPGREDV